MINLFWANLHSYLFMDFQVKIFSKIWSTIGWIAYENLAISWSKLYNKLNYWSKAIINLYSANLIHFACKFIPSYLSYIKILVFRYFRLIKMIKNTNNLCEKRM